MATQAVTDLCKVILRDVYGEVAETIVGSLLEHGRLTAQQIAKHTDLCFSCQGRACRVSSKQICPLLD